MKTFLKIFNISNKAPFIAKLNNCESEAAETQMDLKFPVKRQHIFLE